MSNEQGANMKWLVLAAVMALGSSACTKAVGTAPTDQTTSGATSAPSAPAASSDVSNVAAAKVVVPAPAGAAPGDSPAVAPADTTPTVTMATQQIETPVMPLPPAVLEATSGVEGKLAAITATLDGTKVRFVDCSQGATCSARLEAQTLTGLRDLLRSVSAQQGDIGFTAREQLDGFLGRTFVADVTLGGDATRPVPTDESALLTN
jgi:hypothetical protein